MRGAELLARLIKLDMSMNELARLAQVNESTIRRFVRGTQAPRQSTLRQIKRVLKNERHRVNDRSFVKGDRRKDWCLGLYKSVAAVVCADRGLELDELVQFDPVRQAFCYDILRARREAIYLVLVGNAISQAELGRALNVSREAVRRIVAEVEASRDDLLVNARLDRLEAICAGVEF